MSEDETVMATPEQIERLREAIADGRVGGDVPTVELVRLTLPEGPDVDWETH